MLASISKYILSRALVTMSVSRTNILPVLYVYKCVSKSGVQGQEICLSLEVGSFHIGIMLFELGELGSEL